MNGCDCVCCRYNREEIERLKAGERAADAEIGRLKAQVEAVKELLVSWRQHAKKNTTSKVPSYWTPNFADELEKALGGEK